MNHPEIMRDLPPDITEKLSSLLDENKAWERIVRRFMDVNINVFSVEDLKHETYPSSPARKLIKLMSNFKVSDVYVTLATLELTSAMQTIENYVSPATRQMVEGTEAQSASNETRISYIYQLPEEIRIQLCQVLDSDPSWKFLFSRFEDAGLDIWTLLKCEKEEKSSPSYEFLKLLADRNFKISLLYTALASLNLRKAMSLLESYVSENLCCKVHSLIRGNESQDKFNKVSNIVSDPGTGIASQSSLSCASHQKHNAGQSHSTRKFPPQSSQFFSRRGASSNGITYRELQVATNGWDENSRLTSKDNGKFYRGMLNDSEVAIKKLSVRDRSHCNKVLEELRILRLANHRNILKMSRIIEGSDTPCVIYPFLKNKSLYDHLMKRSAPTESTETSLQLSWKMKYDIASGIADALLFLHNCFNCAVVVKSSDVLLNERMDPLVADICLPCMLSDNPPEDLALYLPTKKFQPSQNVDSFCAGVIILELAMGKTADSLGRHPSQKMKQKFTIDEVDYISHDIQMNWRALVGFCYRGDSIDSVAKAVKYNRLYD